MSPEPRKKPEAEETAVDPATVGLHSLSPAPGSKKDRKRIGRGHGSGWGKTSGRGHKGAGARSGNKRKPGYEGGQNPIHMRTRKLRGLSVKQVLGLDLQEAAAKEADRAAQAEAAPPPVEPVAVAAEESSEVPAAEEPAETPAEEHSDG